MVIKIPSDEVRRHAADVDEIARMLDEARTAASHIRASGGAYGPLVGPLFTNLYLNPHGDEAIASYRGAVDGVHALAELLRAMADEFDRGDERAEGRMRGPR
ncbi:type VII secretion target [Actinoplanes sp. NPDC051411]|uniref:type VII secretion target n=1 Tax=Actinoplanes sp. NPDC051411 TaxID=3155522 RepID=UPI0034203E83